ncbi:unnamed protein product [Auanema sp. JU1783]|nr:unnamed protein product [Auanema sp. JU1783]
MAHVDHVTGVPVPFTSRLSEPIQAGQTLNVHGTFNAEATRVTINLLQNGHEIPNCDAAFHMNIRFDEKKIVFNTLIGGTWGKEERESIPYKKGDKFDFRIRVLEEHYEISADGKKIHEFKHRTPYSAVEFFQVQGDLSLAGVHWGGKFYNLPWTTGFPHNHLRAGQRIYMYGIPKGDKWNLDLLGQNGDILLHFNPRFKEKAIVRNSHRNGFWDNEEREGHFPFHKNEGFSLTIVNEPYSIQHRTANPSTDYVGLRLDGEVEVTGIEFSHH